MSRYPDLESMILRGRTTPRKHPLNPRNAPPPRVLSGQPFYAAQAGAVGSAMQRGQGRAYREGALGMTLALTNDNLIFLTIGAIAGLIAVKKGFVKKGFLGT